MFDGSASDEDTFMRTTGATLIGLQQKTWLGHRASHREATQSAGVENEWSHALSDQNDSEDQPTPRRSVGLRVSGSP